MDKIMLITNFLLLTCTLMIVQYDARRLEAMKLARLEAKKLMRLEARKLPEKVGDVRSIKLDTAKLELDYQLLEKWYKDGVSLEDARKQSPAVDRIITEIIDRNKQDPIKPDGTMKAMVFSTYSMALCALAQRSGNQTHINTWCL